jgi:two-component system NtrC family sensor kinase
MLGAILLGCRDVREFSSAEINLLSSVANQVSASIERIKLLHETQTAYDDLRRTQEQLLQSEKMAAIGQLISGVAHELNNPLTAILGYSQLLSSGEVSSDRGAEYVDKIHKQARRTHRIVNNLLSFARQQRPQRNPVRINQAIEDILALREYDLRINNIRIHRDFGEPLPFVSADTHQLQQVFLNIINNSVDAILERSSQGDLWVRTAQLDDRVLIEFVDSGPGVEDAHRVFDPFYTTKPVGKGTGLGLSICYGIVSEHGGEIHVENVPEHGACFTITLPIPLAVENSPASSDGAPAIVRGKVLLVDDEEAVLGLEKEILESRALSVTAVRSGEEAMNLLSSETVDLIVTDMKMPGLVSGIALYEWVRNNRPELARKIVFTMSDAATDSTSATLREAGIMCVQKPFEVETFWGAIQRTLREAEPVQIKH